MSIKEMAKNAGILLVITVIAGAILGLVYQTTKDTIATRKEDDKKAAYKEVFADAADFTAADATMFDAERGKLDEAGYAAETIDELVCAVDDGGNTLGYVFVVTTSEGYGGDIQFAVGVRNDGTINGISILAISETAGLGMNAEKVLKPQFANKQVSSFTYTKTGSTNDSEIDAISGATITTNAFVNGVNCALAYYNDCLGGTVQ